MPPKSQGRVLLIDDDQVLRELLVALMEAEGYAVTSAHSGDAALALLETMPRPDLVLTDMQMPGATPEQLAGRLRRACSRNTLLLAMSGTRPPDATLAHFDGFLLKPFDVAEIEAVRRAPPRAGAAAPARPASAGRDRPRPAILGSLAASAQAASSSRADRGAPAPSPTFIPHAPPILDDTIYSQLAGSMPSPQLKEMYDMCIDDARSRIASMRSLAAAHDGPEFKRQAHAIKGGCGMLGAAELHRIAAGLEERGPDAPGSAVNSLDELASACDRLERMLRARA